VPLIPILSVLASVSLMLNLASATSLRFAVWIAVGLIVSFGYSRRNSRLAGEQTAEPRAQGAVATGTTGS